MAKIPPLGQWQTNSGWMANFETTWNRKTLYRSMRGRINSERAYIPGKTRFSTARNQCTASRGAGFGGSLVGLNRRLEYKESLR